MTIAYVRISEDNPLPEINGHVPFRAVVVLADAYSEAWQHQVSKWLVENGCLYMMAWGPNCTTWDDSVDYANLDQFDHGDIPDDRFVMTTWHDNEPLSEVFWFAGHCASHGTVELSSTLIIHISHADREEELLSAFARSQVTS